MNKSDKRKLPEPISVQRTRELYGGRGVGAISSKVPPLPKEYRYTKLNTRG